MAYDYGWRNVFLRLDRWSMADMVNHEEKIMIDFTALQLIMIAVALIAVILIMVPEIMRLMRGGPND